MASIYWIVIQYQIFYACLCNFPIITTGAMFWSTLQSSQAANPISPNPTCDQSVLPARPMNTHLWILSVALGLVCLLLLLVHAIGRGEDHALSELWEDFINIILHISDWLQVTVLGVMSYNVMCYCNYFVMVERKSKALNWNFSRSHYSYWIIKIFPALLLKRTFFHAENLNLTCKMGNWSPAC